MSPQTPCNGRGTCGKCRVRVERGSLSAPQAQERSLVPAEDLAAGVRLACLARVSSDVDVRVPSRAGDVEPLAQGRVTRHFAADRGQEGVGLAVDVGTTTLACSLVRLSDGAELARAACLNAQTRFGADVFTRISHAMEGGDEARAALQVAVVGSVNETAASACEQAGMRPDEIRMVSVAANCVMTHMLLGQDARPLGTAPYTPAFTDAMVVPASHIGIRAAADAELYCLPQACAFVGGDIVAGLLVCGADSLPGTCLFVDIGTNGELVLACQGGLLSTSCALGPALEGMNISCGMRAEPGAVEDAHVDEDGRLRLDVIAGGEPTGVCGSGVLALVRELLACGVLEARGTIARPEAFAPDDPRRVLIGFDARGKRRIELGGGPGLVLTQGDVRQVQTAKGALLSGVLTLLDAAGITPADVDAVLVAGQFGAHLPAASLVGTGMLPAEFADKILYVGNTSLAGAAATLTSAEARDQAGRLARAATYIDLSQSPGYERLFARCTQFPK